MISSGLVMEVVSVKVEETVVSEGDVSMGDGLEE